MKADERLQLMRQDLESVHTSLRDMESNAMRFYQETNQHEMVKAFHKKFGVAMPDAPTFDFPVELRLNLIDEEFTELKEAIAAGDMAEFVDAVCDLLFVVHGIALSAGIQHVQPFAEEVFRSNMTKTPGRFRHDGKIEKGPNFSPPDIAGLLGEHYPNGA